MTNNNLTSGVKTVRVKPDGAAFALAPGQTTVTSDIIDTQGVGGRFMGLRFIMLLGAIVAGAVLSFKLQECDTIGGVYTDIPTTQPSNPIPMIVPPATATNGIAILEAYRPKRFVKLVTARATQNSEIVGMTAELFNATIEPVTPDASVAAQAVLR